MFTPRKLSLLDGTWPIACGEIKTIAKSNTIKFDDCHGVLENMVLLIGPPTTFKGTPSAEYREVQYYLH